MPRSFVLANDTLYSAWDSRGVMRELCTGGVGGPNHLNGNPIRFGLFADGKLRWLEDWSWDSDSGYLHNSVGGSCEWKDEAWRVMAEFLIDANLPLIRVRLTVTNLSEVDKEAKVFVHEDLSIGESDIGDTAMFQPQSQSILHFKERVCIAFGWADGPPDGFACGITRFGDAEGVWRDAEDGELSGNAIAQGSVDSVQYRKVSLGPSESKSLELLISAHESVFDPIGAMHTYTKRSFEAEQSANEAAFGYLREAASSRLPLLPPEYVDFAARCLQILLAHCDPGGAIIAANDSFILTTNRAHYRYCWMRDGAEISSVLANFGFIEIERRFIEFCAGALQPGIPFFLQKYTASGAFGATWHPWLGPEGSPIVPMQADETARVVRAASEAIMAGRIDESLAENLVFPCAEFLARFANADTGLCLPCYDLWEERWGIHAATVVETIAALQSAAVVAKKYGNDSELLELGLARMVVAYQNRMLDADGIPFRMLDADGTPDQTVDSACLLPFLLNDKQSFGNLSSTWKKLQASLSLQTSVGGWARYEGDYYFRRHDDLPGNAWPITTLWAARTAPSPREAIVAAIDWTIERSNGGTIAEQYDPRTGEPLSVSPLAWSHCEVLAAMIDLNDLIGAETTAKSSK